MVSNFNYRKYKDRHYLKNTSVSDPLTYTLSIKDGCSGKIKGLIISDVPGNTEVELVLHEDGDYQLDLLRVSNISTQVIQIKSYLRLQKALIYNILGYICGIEGGCIDCDDNTSRLGRHQSIFNQLLAYQHLVKPDANPSEYCDANCLFDGFLYKALALSTCSLKNYIYTDLYNELLTAKQKSSDRAMEIFSSIYYLCYYFYEKLLAVDTEEKEYVDRKFHMPEGEVCIRKYINCYADIEALFVNVANDCNQPPTVGNVLKEFFDVEFTEDEVTYQFLASDFTNNFSDPNGDLPNAVKVLDPPFRGKLYYNGVQVNQPNFTFNIANVGLLQYKFTIQETNTQFDIIYFQINDNNPSPKYSNMAKITISVEEYINKPPTEVGDNSFTLLNRATKVFTVADFTTTTTPQYQDPEGDPADALRIDSLPIAGALFKNNVPCTVNQIILMTEIAGGLFTYVSPDQNNTASTEWNFSLRDTGSHQFSS